MQLASVGKPYTVFTGPLGDPGPGAGLACARPVPFWAFGPATGPMLSRAVLGGLPAPVLPATGGPWRVAGRALD